MKLFKKYFTKLFIVAALILLLVGCDQATKKVANSHLKNQAHKELAGIINLQYVENDGGMLSLGSKLPDNVKFVIFILIVSIFLAVLFFYIIKSQHNLFIKQSALILILSGGLGNLIDRIFNDGNVIDFITINLPLIESGIFNIADFYVTLGFILLLLTISKKEKINIIN